MKWLQRFLSKFRKVKNPLVPHCENKFGKWKTAPLKKK